MPRAMIKNPPLNRTAAPDHAIDALPERIVQFGEGNFLRAFVDWMVDVANRQGKTCGRVVVVQPIERGMVADLAAQDCRYHVVARGMENGSVKESISLVSSISRGLNPYTDWKGYLTLAAQPGIQVVVSNTTEAGISYTAEFLVPGKCPASFPAKVCAFLKERFERLGGPKAPGLVFLPCELIAANGSTLKECVLKHAVAWNLDPALVSWIADANHFCNTLVDRIVPGFPKAEIAELREKARFDDRLMVAAEWFCLWVIEGSSLLAARLPLHEAGLNVIWTDDLAPFRTRKVRILNGAHTMMVLGAFLGGKDTVGECLNDSVVSGFLKKGIEEEIIPYFDLPLEQKRQYAADVLERFANPFIRHELLSISLNSVSKWSVRVLPSLEGGYKANGKISSRLAWSLAALIAFYKGVPAQDGSLTGERNGKPYPIRDDAPVLAAMCAHWQKYGNDPKALALAVCKDQTLWKRDLTEINGLAQVVGEHLYNILTKGALASMNL